MTRCVQQMYDAASPRPALNTVTLFVLWLRLETPALFPHSIYHTVSSWADAGGSAGSAGATQPSIFTGRDQKSRFVVFADKWRIPLPSQKHLSQFVSLLISADAGFRQEFLLLFEFLLRSQSEIKDGASGLGVGARDVGDIFHSRPRGVCSRLVRARSSHPTTKSDAPSYHPSKWAFYGPSKDNELPEWKERSQREVTANTPDAD